MATLEPGSRLGSYEVQSVLGEGGMGVVYRARDTELHRDVAIKVLLPDVVGDPDRLARFGREAQVLASLNHPNIAAIYGVEKSQGTYALVMELVEGQTLDEVIATGVPEAERVAARSRDIGGSVIERGAPRYLEGRRRGLPLADALAIAQQIANALEAAHDAGIIHRDLKPANVKVRPDGTVKVLDFGLAKAFDPATDASRAQVGQTPTVTARATQLGLIVGTPAYMSPEQASGKPVDRRTDIWAFGVVLFEMVTGRRLFEGETISHVLAAVLRDEPDIAAAPAELRPLLTRCLQKDPRKRLRDIGDAMGFVEPTGVDRAAQPVARSWSALAGWSAAGLLAGALAVVGWSRTDPPVGTGEGEAPAVRFQIERSAPNNSVNATTAFALSPDGRFLAHYGIGAGGRILLSVRTQATGETREVPDSIAPNQSTPFWSMDSRYVAYSTTRATQVFDVTTGTVRDLCACRFQGGSWNRSGVILLGGWRPGEPIQRLTLEDRTLRPATPANTATGARDQWPVFLPDGLRFLFTRTTTNQPAATYLASLDGGEPTRVTDGSRRMFFSSPGAGGQWLLGIEAGGLVAQAFDARSARTAGEPLVVMPGAIAASISENGVLATSPTGGRAITRPTWFDRTGEVLGYVGDPGPLYAASLSPDGRSVVVQEPGTRTGEGGTGFIRTSTGGNRRLPANQGASTVWSPDGARMIVSAFRDGRVNLFLVAADGSGGEMRLFPSSGDVHANDWSRDGRWAIYTSRKDEGSELDLDLWVYPMDGRSDAKPAPYLTSSAREAQAEFSPDGRFVAYTSTEIGAPAVYVQPFPDASGGKWLISSDGGVEPHWNPDGTELFYFSGQTLMAVPVRLQPTFLHGTPVRLFDAPVMPWYVNDSDRTQVTDRGKRFLILVNSEKNVVPPLDVVVNWPSLLDRRER